MRLVRGAVPAAAVVVTASVLGGRYPRRGATVDEVAMTLPGDEIV